MSDVINLDEHRPIEPTFSVQFYRLTDGSDWCAVASAEQWWKDETEPITTADRMRLCAKLMTERAKDLMDQADQIEKEESE